jgi:hypothetical protein
VPGDYGGEPPAMAAWGPPPRRPARVQKRAGPTASESLAHDQTTGTRHPRGRRAIHSTFLVNSLNFFRRTIKIHQNASTCKGAKPIDSEWDKPENSASCSGTAPRIEDNLKLPRWVQLFWNTFNFWLGPSAESQLNCICFKLFAMATYGVVFNY